MSYRTFKRLLGETSLERKCRLLFGLATLCLITGSFIWYGWITEGLAYDQVDTTGRLAASHALIRAHLNKGLNIDQHRFFDQLPEPLMTPESKVETTTITAKTQDKLQLLIFTNFQTHGMENEEPTWKDGNYVYNLGVRAKESCLACHRTAEPIVQEKDALMAVISVKIPANDFNDRVHRNRAILISTAFISALLLMTGSWLIVRYVIVKPVKHLKEVSDAIASGNLNIRSEILTGDEFEDLSHAYNRMLRSLMSKEDELRKVNSDLNKTVDDLAQANLALHTANRLKDDFLTTMSHELRTPLSSIIGFSDLLTGGPSLSDKQRKWLENIHSSGKHLLNLLNDVLELAKIEAGKMQVRAEEFVFADLCEGVISIFKQLAESKKLALDCSVDPAIPRLHQDPQKLRQILLNLLSNAIKFTPEGGSIHLHAVLEGDDLVIKVIDTGIGISPEDQETVFEKFRQSSQVLTREKGGSGLGLSISKELAKILGGDITLQSTLGRGTTFTVRLPVRLDDVPDGASQMNGEVGDVNRAFFKSELAGTAGHPSAG